uniref:SFRICE_013782 n=1 Tax=Spodoptera frugiperda TaxID=7108 RepID=A0A2H1VEM0_SPOFR
MVANLAGPLGRRPNRVLSMDTYLACNQQDRYYKCERLFGCLSVNYAETTERILMNFGIQTGNVGDAAGRS